MALLGLPPGPGGLGLWQGWHKGPRLPSRAEAGPAAWGGPGQALSLPHYTSVAGPHS